MLTVNAIEMIDILSNVWIIISGLYYCHLGLLVYRMSQDCMVPLDKEYDHFFGCDNRRAFLISSMA